jgi:hypothetical protein
MNKETVLGCLFWAGILGGSAVVLVTCQHNTEKQKQTAKQNAENEFNEFCRTNDAAPAFKGLPKSNLLTTDLQRSLFVKKKRVAFKAQLVDVYRSEKRGTMTASFGVDHGDANIYVYLKCTESQAQALYDIYQREKNATLLIAAEFEEVEPTAQSNSDSNSESASAYKEAYSALGTLVASKVAKWEVRPDSTSAVQDDND